MESQTYSWAPIGGIKLPWGYSARPSLLRCQGDKCGNCPSVIRFLAVNRREAARLFGLPRNIPKETWQLTQQFGACSYRDVLTTTWGRLTVVVEVNGLLTMRATRKEHVR